MIKKLQFFIVLASISILIFSCGKSSKESAGNLTGSSVVDATEQVMTMYGTSGKIVFKGDMTGNKREDILALVINKQFDSTRYWIQKGSVIEKDLTGWKTLLSMEEKLKTPKGEMVEQLAAKNGYIVKFIPGKTPMNIFISIADDNGRPSSDEATIKWNAKDSIYEFTAGNEDGTP